MVRKKLDGMDDTVRESRDRWLVVQEMIKDGGRWHAVWSALPTAPRYTNMRISLERGLTDEVLGYCTVGFARLNIAEAEALRDELNSAIATYEKHIADGTGEE